MTGSCEFPDFLTIAARTVVFSPVLRLICTTAIPVLPRLSVKITPDFCLIDLLIGIKFDTVTTTVG